MSKPFLKITSDFTDNLSGIMQALKMKETLVGIPEQKGERKDDAPINNAALLYINEFGSPAQNIPARPVMSIGIRMAQREIADEYKKAAVDVLSMKGIGALDNYYQRAGFIASSSVKMVINNQTGIVGPSEATLKARQYIGKSGFKGTKALVVTGQMRNAITFVVSEKGLLKKRGG